MGDEAAMLQIEGNTERRLDLSALTPQRPRPGMLQEPVPPQAAALIAFEFPSMRSNQLIRRFEFTMARHIRLRVLRPEPARVAHAHGFR